jgi:predicted HicB family RNase H-like nuclease
MKYKGYTGVVEFDEDSGTLFGHVIGLRDGITFQGDSVAEVIQAFHDSVDDYLEFCAERGESPEKPYSGQFVLRIDPRLHRVMSHAAEERGVSLNSLVEEKLTSAFSLGELAEAEPFSLAEEPLEEDALLVGGGGGRTKGATGRVKRPAKPGKAPSRQGVRPSVAAKKAQAESGQELKIPAKRRIAKGRKG